MLYKISINKLIFIMFFLSSIFFVSMLVFFFINLSNTTSNFSMGAVTAPLQLFYNFMHDRPFQTSLFSMQGGDNGTGIVSNPFPYAHINIIHTYLTPFLFAPLWNLWPTQSWLYGLVILVNYLGMAIFTWKMFKYLSPQTKAIKTVFAMTLLLSSGFLYTFSMMAQFLLFSGPFILAAYYFVLTQQRVKYLLAMVLLCLISEDAAMVAVTFAFYIYLFEDGAKSYGLQGGLLALLYLFTAMFFLQPAARGYLELSSSTTAQVVISHLFEMDIFSIIGTRITSDFVPALFFFPVFGIIVLLFGKPDISWLKVVALILIPPFPHWGESFVVGAVHHLMPVIMFIFIAFIMVLAKTEDVHKNELSLTKKRTVILFILFIIIVIGTFRVSTAIFPDKVRLVVYNLAGMTDKIEKMEVSSEEKKKNIRIIDVVKDIPKQNSLVYLTNSSVQGFIADRSDIWAFPFFYKNADYLVMQSGARQSDYDFTMDGYLDIESAINGRKFASLTNGLITKEFVNTIVNKLVNIERTHKIVINEMNVVLLERIIKQPMQSHPSTIGFGWMPNIFSHNVNSGR